MRKGFTLVELLAVIVILALIGIIIMPSVINIMSESTTEVNEANKKTVLAQAEIFVLENSFNYEKVNGNVYCITIDQLKDENFLDTEFVNGLDESVRKLIIGVKIQNDKYHYELVSECN